MESYPALVELVQLNEYARIELAVYVSWFSFFLTLLLGAMGWTLRAALDKRGRVKTPEPFFFMVFLFTIQLGLAISGTIYIIGDLSKADARSKELLQHLADLPSNQKTLAPVTPFPTGMHTAMKLMLTTLIVNMIFWVAVAVIVWFRNGRTLGGWIPANNSRISITDLESRVVALESCLGV